MFPGASVKVTSMTGKKLKPRQNDCYTVTRWDTREHHKTSLESITHLDGIIPTKSIDANLHAKWNSRISQSLAIGDLFEVVSGLVGHNSITGEGVSRLVVISSLTSMCLC